MGDIADPTTAGAVERYAKSSSEGVRSAVAWALGRMRQPTSIPVVSALLEDTNPAVHDSALQSLGAFRSVEAALPLLRALARDSTEEQLNDALDLEKGVIAEACRTVLAEPGVKAEEMKSRQRVCEWLQRPDAQRVYTWSSVDLHARLYSQSNPDARTVRPAKGRKAEAWKDAVGKENGGTRQDLRKGEALTIWSAALYRGETWFEVARGPYKDHVWIRERDVERVTAQATAVKTR